MSTLIGFWRLSASLRWMAMTFVLCGTMVVEQASAADEKSTGAGTGKPATVTEAVRVLDLTTFPLLKGAKEPVNRSVARLSYTAPSDCKTAFEFQRKTLASQKWTELPGSNATAEYANGTFTRDGFVASMSVSPLGDPKQPGMVNVSLMLHGNVDLKKLPMPADLKPTYVGPQVAMYSTDVSVEKTAEACRKLLLAQGWQPYGKAGDTQFFKQNAIRLTAYITAAPALKGKTSVSFTAEQLSADVPAPADTVDLQYSDSTKQVLFDTKGSEDSVEAFYRKTLGSAGWKATTDNTVKIGFKDMVIFRNAAQDMFSLEMYEMKDEQVLRVTLKHQSAAEVAAIEKRLDEESAAKKSKKETPLTRVKIVLPPGAKLTEEAKTRLEFTVGAGKAKTTAESIRKGLRDAGWKEVVTTADAMVGEIEFTKDNQELTLSYVDTGFLHAEFTIRGPRVELEKATAGKE
ncbi:MAG: hypothetical protein HZA46_08660 [Planctomycetales bacterium]|nr:hypothetical protein [Planctomycetales bacterium]